MLDKAKLLFLYCYEATEKMEARAERFAEERQKRMEEFRAHREAAEAKAKTKLEEMRAEIREQVRESLGNVGVATKDELDEIKTLLTDLSKKVDSLAKK